MAVTGIQYPLQPLGIPIRVVQWGLTGEPVLMIHGLGSRAEAFEPLGSRLADQGYRCFAIDLPGHGLSYKGPDFDYTAAGHTRLLAALQDALDVGPLHLVASSLGGLHAAAYATGAPERLASLTLIGSIGLAAMTEERRAWTATYLKDMSRDAIARRFTFAVADPSIFDAAYLEENWRVNVSPGAAESFARIGAYYLGSINEDLQTQRLGALGGRLPILLLWGQDDQTVPLGVASDALPRIPGATLCSLAGARHIPHLEKPDLVAAQVAAHLAGKRGPAAPGVESLRHADLAAAP